MNLFRSPWVPWLSPASRGDDSDPAVFRRALNANLRLGGMAEAERLDRVRQGSSRPADVRREALLALADWDKSPALDRVRDVSGGAGTHRGAGTPGVVLGCRGAARPEDPELSADVTRIVVQQRIPAPGAVFARWVAATNQSVEVRVRALEFLRRGIWNSWGRP